MKRLLTFSANVEIATGLALLLDPTVVVRLLVGAGPSDLGTLLGRFLGVALISLGVACWPDANGNSQSLRGLKTYNVAVAIYLAFVGTRGEATGLLLWPAVAFHSVLSALLLGANSHNPRP